MKFFLGENNGNRGVTVFFVITLLSTLLVPLVANNRTFADYIEGNNKGKTYSTKKDAESAAKSDCGNKYVTAQVQTSSINPNDPNAGKWYYQCTEKTHEEKQKEEEEAKKQQEEAKKKQKDQCKKDGGEWGTPSSPNTPYHNKEGCYAKGTVNTNSPMLQTDKAANDKGNKKLEERGVDTTKLTAGQRQELIEKCKISDEECDKAVAAIEGENGTKEGGESSCQVDGIGWLVCPVITFLASASEGMYEKIVEPMLQVKASSWFEGGDSLEQGWIVIRDISNVILVIVLLLIIMSQITGIGISNYGIKKMAPKLIIAAILANVSFWICALLVDISNIVGSNLYSILSDIGGSVSGAEATTLGGGFPVLSQAILVGGAIAMVLLGGGVFAIVALTLVVAWVSLIARQTLLIVLVVASPLAFILMVFPNTESWFTRWRKMFTTLLFLYPVIAFIMGISGFASKVVSGAADTGGSGFEDTLPELAGAMVAVIPLVAVPFILKKTMSGLEGIGGAIGRVQTSLGGAAEKAGGKADKLSRLATRTAARGATNKFKNTGVGRRMGNSAVSKKIAGATAWARRVNANAEGLDAVIGEEHKERDARAFKDWAITKGIDNLSPTEKRQFVASQNLIDKQEDLTKKAQSSSLADQFRNFDSSGLKDGYASYLSSHGITPDKAKESDKLAYISSTRGMGVSATRVAAKDLGFSGGEIAAATERRIANAYDSNVGSTKDRMELSKEFNTTSLGNDIKASSPALHELMQNMTNNSNDVANGISGLSDKASGNSLENQINNKISGATTDPNGSGLNYNKLSNEKKAMINDDEMKRVIDAGKITDDQLYSLATSNNGAHLNSFDAEAVEKITDGAKRYMAANPTSQDRATRALENIDRKLK